MENQDCAKKTFSKYCEIDLNALVSFIPRESNLSISKDLIYANTYKHRQL